MAAPLEYCVTVIEKDGSERLPCRRSHGSQCSNRFQPARRWVVPESLPVDVLNEAQLGRLLTENVSGSPFASLAVGWKL